MPQDTGASNGVTISRELYDFLMGVGPINGTWFDEMNRNMPGRFWWRALLATSRPKPSESALQVAFDSGCGQRGISHRHENPHSETTQPELHAEWERGWAKTDAESESQDIAHD